MVYLLVPQHAATNGLFIAPPRPSRDGAGHRFARPLAVRLAASNGEDAGSPLLPNKLGRMKIAELKTILASRGLSTEGVKAELLARIKGHDAVQEGSQGIRQDDSQSGTPARTSPADEASIQAFLRTGDFDLLAGLRGGPPPQKSDESELRLQVEALQLQLTKKDQELQSLTASLLAAEEQLLALRSAQIAELTTDNLTLASTHLQLAEAQAALGKLIPVRLNWSGRATSVSVSGSFDGWSTQVPLVAEAGSSTFTGEIYLYAGVYEFKFILDGVWVVDERFEQINTKDGHENNLLRVG